MEQLDRRSLIAGASLIGAGVVASLGWNASAAGPNPNAGVGRGGADSEPRTPIDQTTTPGDSTAVFKVTVPGSYYLTANVTGAAGKAGIEIATSGVTIDLMGFCVRGASGSLSGIRTGAGQFHNLTIRNGVVMGWGQRGIDLAFSGLGTGGVIENVLASSNAGHGIRTNQFAKVRCCSALSNGGAGIVLLDGGSVESVVAALNGSLGISAGNGVIVDHSVARENLGDGIGVGNGSTVVECSAFGNGGSGVASGFACGIHRCTASSNAQDGIRASGDCTIRENTCSANGLGTGVGAGIRVTNSDCRVESNNSTCNGRGYSIDGFGNLFIRNTASGNGTNFVLNTHNQYGTIMDRTTVPTPAVNGDSANGTLSTFDSQANIAF